MIAPSEEIYKRLYDELSKGFTSCVDGKRYQLTTVDDIRVRDGCAMCAFRYSNTGQSCSYHWQRIGRHPCTPAMRMEMAEMLGKAVTFRQLSATDVINTL